MSLKAELKALQNRLEAGRAPEALTEMHRAVEELRTAEILGRVLRVGDRAPEFALPDATGAPVDSRQRLAAGPLVVTFYRGRW
jgi:hypothetical protein